MSRRRHTAERTCVGCRATKPATELIRLVLAPDGQIAVDLDRRLPGRGAHICPSLSCIEEAVRKGAFGRAFRRAVEQPDAGVLVDRLRTSLERKLSGLLGRGYRSGQVLSGAVALEKGIQRGQVHLLVLAVDIAEKQRDKLLALYSSSGRPWAACFSKTELGAMLGKELRSAAGFTNPKMAEAAGRALAIIEEVREAKGGDGA